MLVAGQQDRMLRGSDVWGHPVAYDKLGIRYRRWRNSVAAGSSAERAQVSTPEITSFSNPFTRVENLGLG